LAGQFHLSKATGSQLRTISALVVETD